MDILSDLARYGRLFFKYRSFLQHPYTLEDCKRLLRERMENRERRLLSLMKAAIFDNPSSPYRPLLAEARCAYGDFESGVLQDGIEPTLEKLHRAGVFFTFEQFKYGKPVECGGKTYQFMTSDFDNPLLPNAYYVGRSGGTRSSGTPARQTLHWMEERAIYYALTHDVYNVSAATHLLWKPRPPAVNGINSQMRWAKSGVVPLRWFSMTDRTSIRLSLQSRLGPPIFRYLGRLFGTRFPPPEFLPLSGSVKLARLIAQLKREGRKTLLRTYTSCGVRVCQSALEHDLDIAGLTIVTNGEPSTPRKVAEMKAAGAIAVPEYNSVELGNIGIGCANPEHSDDMHFLCDSHAVIRVGRKLPWADEELGAFVYTSISSFAPKIMLNVEMDDCGVMERRSCGCGFEEYGFVVHFHTVRSFSKLSAEGMKIVSSDFLRVIEEVLPERHGGNSTDYQLVQEEDEKGLTRMIILVHPRLEAIDEQALLATFHDELRKGEHFRQESRDLVLNTWSQAKTLRVRREPPRSNLRGKVLPFHLDRSIQAET